MSDVILEALKTIQDAVDKMSPQEVHLRFELSQYKIEIQQLKQQLEKLKFQLDVAEAVLSVQVTKSAVAYFKDKIKSLENNVNEN